MVSVVAIITHNADRSRYIGAVTRMVVGYRGVSVTDVYASKGGV